MTESGETWLATVPVLGDFAQVADPACYVPLPDDWFVGVSDVVDSTGAIAAGRYKAVNLAGAAAISAVTNALGGGLSLFVFGGDGARFAVPPDQAAVAAAALSRVAMWAGRELELRLRVGMVCVAEIRAAGRDVRVALWRASDHVRYAMFTGAGLDWAEGQLKRGAIGLAPSSPGEEPDLAGLSCQWGPIRARQGNILSLIVRQAPGAPAERFAEIVTAVIAIVEDEVYANPVPPAGPDVHWPGASIELQSRVAHAGTSVWRRRLRVLAGTALTWLVFKLGVGVGRFDPTRYRREIAVNTDFRKFDDGLMMTIDCSPGTANRLRAILEEAAAEGVVRYGLHMQDKALMTCVVPSVVSPDHVHFVDGADGGYAAAARQLRGEPVAAGSAGRLPSADIRTERSGNS